MSLERKILLSFMISAGLIAVFAATAALNFVEIRRGITHLELADTLRSKALQLRRHEKNYFLYGEAAERDQVRAYLDELDAILETQTRAFGIEMGSLAAELAAYRRGFERIEAAAGEFRSRLREAAAGHPRLAPLVPIVDAVILERPLVSAEVLARFLDPAETAPLVAVLRHLKSEIEILRHRGEELVALTKGLDLRARTLVERGLRHSGRAALVLFPLSLLVGLASLVIISHSVVRRLKLLTAVIEKTGKGDFTPVEDPRESDEIGILVKAVNTMESELAAREREIAAKGEELHQSRKLAAIGTLASGVAHELNNPLSNISLSAQMLAREIPGDAATPYVREVLDDIVSQTERVKRIMGDLLEFAREKPLELRRTDLAALVRDAATRSVPGGVELHLDLPASAPVMGDAHRLMQLFVNLFVNAVDATGGAGALQVSLAADAERVQVGVSDTGRGIHPDDLPKVFDPFFTTKERGTGLGLAIVYNIVRKHGGAIEVASRLERGTTFTVTLPTTP